MSYSVKECQLTIQGEGAQAGRAAVFLRFTGCNLWTGREKDRGKAVCKFCDTDFIGTDGVGGGKFAHPMELAQHVSAIWDRGDQNKAGHRLVVCTGGEPLLQLDKALVRCLHQMGFSVAVETNGTVPFINPLPNGLNIDWVCVSPKAGSVIKVTEGNELKLVYPQEENNPAMFEDLDFENFFLQPKDESRVGGPSNEQACIDYILKHPKWRLSLQTHKLLNIP